MQRRRAARGVCRLTSIKNTGTAQQATALCPPALAIQNVHHHLKCSRAWSFRAGRRCQAKPLSTDSAFAFRLAPPKNPGVLKSNSFRDLVLKRSLPLLRLRKSPKCTGWRASKRKPTPRPGREHGGKRSGGRRAKLAPINAANTKNKNKRAPASASREAPPRRYRLFKSSRSESMDAFVPKKCASSSRPPVNSLAF